MTDIVQKLWGFCHTLRHDGMDCGDYIKQITYLLFIKMADETAAGVPAATAEERTSASRFVRGRYEGLHFQGDVRLLDGTVAGRRGGYMCVHMRSATW
jgi:hypothetical protein